MALTQTQIDTMYEEVLARHATAAEQQAFSSLSNSQTKAQIESDIATLPEATSFVDPIIRLYQGAFGRLPDTIDPNSNFNTAPQSGFWVNVNAFRGGLSLVQMAQAFVASPEFTALYGSTTVTPALITAFYQHILGRDPASSEVAAWQATGLDAAHILLGFTQSTEFINSSQPSVDAFKVALADGQHPSGPLPPAPPDFTLTSDHDATGVNEGSTVTFTLQGPIADAGQLFSYTISGVSAADIVGGQLTGQVTLDAQGLAHVAVTLAADQTTEGPETLTLAFGSLTDSVTVNDTSLTPTIVNFTQTVGETLVGGPADTTFQGTVDTSIVGNNTLSNVVDVAQGNAAFHNTEYIIIDNSSGTTITPKSTGVQEMKITNLDQSNHQGGGGMQFWHNQTKVDAQFMRDVTEVTSFGSQKGLDIYNLQNFISTINIEQSDTPGGLNFGVRMIDSTPAGGTQTINLDHAGTGNNGVFLADETTSGFDVVGEFDINSIGQNKITIDGTSVATTFVVSDTGSGADVTTIVSADDTEALTTIDTTGVAGTVKMWGFEVETGNTLNVFEGNGNNTFGIDVEGNGTLIVDPSNGNNTLYAHFVSSDGVTDGGTVIVTEGNGNDKLDVDNDDGGNFQTVTGVYGNGNDNLDVETGNSSTTSLTAGNGNDTVTVLTLDDSTVGVHLGDGANTVTVDDGERSQVTVTGGNGGNNVTINTNDPGHVDPGFELDGQQVYSVTLGTGTDHVTMNVNGSDPTFGGIVDEGTDDVGGNNPNGEPDSVIAMNQTITVALGDNSGPGTQTAWIETGVNSSVTLTSGNGVDNIQIYADNDLWNMDTNDVATFAGSGGSTIHVNTGDGDKNILVNVDNTGKDTSGNVLDTNSSVQIATGSGNDLISVILGTANQGNTANVSAGAGNDRVQFDVADINAGIVADGGSQTTEDTIALVSASAGADFAHLAGLSGFEALEVTDTLVNNVNLDAYEPGNNINHVILDGGFSGTNTISGVEQNAQFDVLAQSSGELKLLVDNAFSNPNDTVNIKLSADSSGVNQFGIIDVNPTVLLTAVEFVNINSVSHALGTTENDLVLEAPGIHTLGITGDTTLNLNGSDLFGITKVDATGFTGGIIDNAPGFGNAGVTFLAPNSGDDHLLFGNGADNVTLGNGNNVVDLGNGNDSFSAGNGNNTVDLGGGTNTLTVGNGNNTVIASGSSGTGGVDTIHLGSGTNSVTGGFQGDQITVDPHGANVDTFIYTHQTDSAFTLPDIINGFSSATDILQFNHSTIPGMTAAVSFVSVLGPSAVAAALASETGTNSWVIFDQASGDVYVDVNHDQLLDFTHDMQIHLTGVSSLTAAHIVDV